MFFYCIYCCCRFEFNKLTLVLPRSIRCFTPLNNNFLFYCEQSKIDRSLSYCQLSMHNNNRLLFFLSLTLGLSKCVGRPFSSAAMKWIFTFNGIICNFLIQHSIAKCSISNISQTVKLVSYFRVYSPIFTLSIAIGTEYCCHFVHRWLYGFSALNLKCCLFFTFNQRGVKLTKCALRAQTI